MNENVSIYREFPWDLAHLFIGLGLMPILLGEFGFDPFAWWIWVHYLFDPAFTSGA